jgi:hypothetical protein
LRPGVDSVPCGFAGGRRGTEMEAHFPEARGKGVFGRHAVSCEGEAVLEVLVSLSLLS